MPKELDRETEEVVYLLFVKAATLPVWLWKFKPELAASGTIVLSVLACEILEGEALYKSAIDYQEWPVGLSRPKYWDVTSPEFIQKFSTLYRARKSYPQDCEFLSVFVQIDVYCSVDEGFAEEEAEFVAFRLKEIYEENPLVNDRYRVFLIQPSGVRDVSAMYKMAPDGFQRVIADFWVILSRVVD